MESEVMHNVNKLFDQCENYIEAAVLYNKLLENLNEALSCRIEEIADR